MVLLGKNGFDNPAVLIQTGTKTFDFYGNLTIHGTFDGGGTSHVELANNTYLTSLAADGVTVLNLLKADASDNTVLNAKTGKVIALEINGTGGVFLSSTELAPDVSGGITLGDTSNGFGTTFLALGKTVQLKAGSNAKAGTFTANGASTVSVATTAFVAGSTVAISLKTVGGSVGAQPHLLTATPGTGFAIVATAGDTSVYNWAIIDQA